MSETLDDTRLIWGDVETTGLENDARLLEVAITVTTADLTVVAEPLTFSLAANDMDLEAMSDTVRTMHTASGLLNECRRSTVTLREAQEQLLEYARAHVPAGVSPLCGSTISFDRWFIARDLPQLNDHLHYRHIDVSTVKELIRRWFPLTYSRLPRREARHRAVPDVLDSIAELRFYRASVFREGRIIPG